MNKLFCLLLFFTALSVNGCGEKHDVKKIGVSYQYGLGYAPVVLAKENGTIEALYKKASGKDLQIEWKELKSGSDINTAIASGEIDVGFMGVSPAILGVSKKIGYRIFASLAGYDNALVTSDPALKQLSDFIASNSQIATVNLGSFQHILLSMALDKAGIDPHSLDSRIVGMSHPDGYLAITSGQIPAHLTTPPYVYQELDQPGIHEITEVAKAWPKDKSHLVGVASEGLHQDTELYNAVTMGISMSQDLIKNDLARATAIMGKYVKLPNEKLSEYLSRCDYSNDLSGLQFLAEFMLKNGFMSESLGYPDLVFENVKGD